MLSMTPPDKYPRISAQARSIISSFPAEAAARMFSASASGEAPGARSVSVPYRLAVSAAMKERDSRCGESTGFPA